MGTILYNSNHVRIYPETKADSVIIGESNVQTKFGDVDGSLSSLGGRIDGVNTEIDNLKNSINDVAEKIPEGLNNSFKSFVFKRQNATPSPPNKDEGSYEFPVPEGWSDGIPDGEEIVWMTSRIFSSDKEYPQEAEWSEPQQMTDMTGFDVDFSSVVTNPGNPTDNPDNWSNESGEDTIWMATRKGSNGTWENWQVFKIKGEDGKDGTSINVKEALTKELFAEKCGEGTEENPWIAPVNPSDSYTVDGELWVWNGSDSWVNVGNIKGEKGDKGETGDKGEDGATPYVHIKYANKSTETFESTFTVTIEGESVLLTPTEGDGETPGNYIGVLANYILDDITEEVKYSDYSWTRWRGEDGFGYEYIYTLGYEAPVIPTDETNPDGDSFLNNDFVPDGWYDNPCTPTESAGHCWICTRQKVGGIWQPYKGDPNNPSYASLYTKYTKDGKDGIDGVDAVNLPIITGIESNIIIPCDSEGGLIAGTHFGAGDNTKFSSYIYLSPKLMIGVNDVTENYIWTFKGDLAFDNEVAARDGNDYLLIEEPTTSWVCTVAGIVKDARQGKITITAATSEEVIATTEVTITKSYNGKKGDPATFTYYELSPNVNLVVAKIGTDGSLKSLTPSTLIIKAIKFTELGREQVTEIPSTYIFDVSCYDTNENIIWTYDSYTCGQELDITKIPETNEAYTTIPRYFLINMTDSASAASDFQRISVLYEYEAASADIPDWVSNWDGNATEIEGNKLLTGKLYAGKSTQTSENWTGVLIGNEVAQVKNLPWMNTEEVKNFSGILGLTSGTLKTNEANEALVSFALDADTGNAYFQGEVNATSGSFENGTITKSEVSNLTVLSDTSKYVVTIGTENSNNTDGTADVFTINAVTSELWDNYVTITPEEILWSDPEKTTSKIEGSGNEENLQYLYLNTLSSLQLYEAIQNAGTDPYFIVEVSQADLFGTAVNVSYPAQITDADGAYIVAYTSELKSMSSIVNINCNNYGQTGEIQVVDLTIGPSGKFSRTTMTGGAFKVEYADDSSFESIYSSVEIGPNGLLIVGIPTVSANSTHTFAKGTLYVDSLGIVRVSNYPDSTYITG